MIFSLHAITFLVRDYDEAIDWFTTRLGFTLIEDTPLSATKRWVKVAAGQGGPCLLLAKADTPEQIAAIGKAAGGRVAFFLYTDDFAGTHARMTQAGVHFREVPRREAYGTVAVFEDLYGNPWDLIEPAATIRPGTIADIDQINIVRTSVRENHLSMEQLADRGITPDYIAEKMMIGEIGCWVAEVGGRVVGFSMAERESANIWALFVLPEHEGQGLGSPLLAACEVWLKSLGHNQAHLDTAKHTRAAEFYRRKGWIAEEYPGRPDDVLFRKRL